MKQISLITFIILTTIFITSSPFIFGLLDTPKGTSYLGTHFLNSGDTFAYYGLYTQVKHGDFLFFNPYTPEKHSAIFFRPTFFLALLIFKIFSTNTITASGSETYTGNITGDVTTDSMTLEGTLSSDLKSALGIITNIDGEFPWTATTQ